MIGAVASIFGSPLLDGGGDFENLEAEVMQLLSAPCLGQAEALRIASRARPARAL